MVLFKILSINPGSTSTKIGIFHDENLIISEKVNHSAEDLEKYDRVVEQEEMRKKDIINFLHRNGYSLSDFDAFSARGGILPPHEKRYLSCK